MNPNEMAGLKPCPTEAGLDRREFLRLGGVLAAAGALGSAACSPPQEATIPFHDMPESLVDGMGRARFFHTVIDGSPVLVRTREGRPILVTPRPDETSGRGLGARHLAALMDLYDPDRARGPLSVRRGAGAPVASNWAVVGSETASRLKAAGAKAVLLTRPIDSPALTAAIAAISARTGLRHVAWSPLENGATSEAWKLAFGDARAARPRLDRADLIVGLGAEFLDRPEEGYERDFAARRSPDATGNRGMSRFVQLEGRLTLTGANADRRIRVRDSHLAAVAAALVHELVVVRKAGPLAAVPEVATALAPFAIEAVARQAGVDPAVLKSLAGEIGGAAGRTLVMAGGSASTSASGPALELSALLLNVAAGAFDAGLFDEEAAAERASGGAAALSSLGAEMLGGGVEMLVLAGVNPVYDGFASARFSEALGKVPFVLSLNDRLDETSLLADVLAPASHPLECWGDAALPKGLLAIQQPVIQPLFDTRGLLDLLVEWGAAVGDPTALAAATAAVAAAKTTPPPASAAPVPSSSLAWHYLRAAWASRLAVAEGTAAFEAAWNEVLRAGSWSGGTGSSSRPAARPFAVAALSLLAGARIKPAPGVELQLYPHLALADGRAGNNGWLQELPDPVTRITWGGALSIAPRRFDEMQLANGDLVEVEAGHAKIVAPAYRHAGMHQDQVALPLGLGRAACGVIGALVGPNAFPLRLFSGGRLLSAGLPVRIRKVGGREELAFAQGSDVIDRDRRPLVPATTLTAYEKDRKSGTEQQEGGRSAWPAFEYPKARWAMAIDLNKCNGCGKCVIACQAENNIPVVGPARHPQRPRDVVDADRSLLRRPEERRRVGRRGLGRPPRGGRGASDALPADALPALRERAVRDRLPVRGDDAQRGRPEPAGVQPLRRHPLLREQLPLQGAPVQLLGVQQGAGELVLPVARAAHRQERGAQHAQPDADEEQPGGDRPEPRRDGEVLLLHPEGPRRDVGGDAPGERERALPGRRRRARVHGIVPGRRHHLRRRERSRLAGRGACRRPARDEAPRRPRRQAVHFLPGEGA